MLRDPRVDLRPADLVGDPVNGVVLPRPAAGRRRQRLSLLHRGADRVAELRCQVTPRRAARTLGDGQFIPGDDDLGDPWDAQNGLRDRSIPRLLQGGISVHTRLADRPAQNERAAGLVDRLGDHFHGKRHPSKCAPSQPHVKRRCDIGGAVAGKRALLSGARGPHAALPS